MPMYRQAPLSRDELDKIRGRALVSRATPDDIMALIGHLDYYFDDCMKAHQPKVETIDELKQRKLKDYETVRSHRDVQQADPFGQQDDPTSPGGAA